jgi:hypothetical protein
VHGAAQADGWLGSLTLAAHRPEQQASGALVQFTPAARHAAPEPDPDPAPEVEPEPDPDPEPPGVDEEEQAASANIETTTSNLSMISP